MELESLKTEVAELKAGDNKELKYYSLGDDIIWQSKKMNRTLTLGSTQGKAAMSYEWIFYPEADGFVSISDVRTGVGLYDIVWFNAADILSNNLYYSPTNSNNSTTARNIQQNVFSRAKNLVPNSIVFDEAFNYGTNPNGSYYKTWGYSTVNQNNTFVQKGLPLMFFVLLVNNYSNSSQSYNFSDFQIKITGTKNY